MCIRDSSQRGFLQSKRRQIHRHAESEGSDSQYVEICYPQAPLVLRMVCIESQLHASGQPELRSLCHPDDEMCIRDSDTVFLSISQHQPS